MKQPHSLMNFGFISLNILVLFAFSNLAIFYSFYIYLDTLPIPKAWHGVIIGLLSASALIIRPFLSTVLTPQNAIGVLSISLGLTATSLALYPHAQTLIPMILLRCLHGAAYVAMASAAVTLLMVFLPETKSGQGFGIISIMTLLPYALIPFTLEKLLPNVTLNQAYVYTAVLMIPPGLLLIPLARYARKYTSCHATQKGYALPKGSLLRNIRQPQILILLAANAMLFSAFSGIFFFLKPFCLATHIGNPGLFFALSTTSMIGVRIVFGRAFDRFNKIPLTLTCLGVTMLGVLILSTAQSQEIFYISSVIYGIGFGAATPLMNSLMFTISQPVYRGLNTNLMLEMVDAGFFIGPTLCGAAIALGLPHTTLFLLCMTVIGLAACTLFPLIKLQNKCETQ